MKVSNELRLLEILERKQGENFAKLFDTPSKFQGQKPRPMEIPHGFFLNTLTLEIPLPF